MRPTTSDRGFTFAEMSVVLALLGILLSITFTGMKVVFDGRAASDRAAWVAREIGSPLQQMEETLTQHLVLEQATPYAVTALVDRPRHVGSTVEFDHLERHVISATTDGRIVEQIWATNEMRQNTSLIRSVIWSIHNSNQAQGSPLFVFRDGAGVPIPASSATTAARRVDVRVVMTYDGRSFEGSRTVFFRNR